MVKIALAALAALIVTGLCIEITEGASPKDTAAQIELATLQFAPYAPQKVVYHVDGDSGFFDHAYIGVLKSMRNHVAAVGAKRIDLRVVVQANGLKMLEHARTNPKLAALIDELRQEGVRFLVCRNSMLEADVPPSALYKVPTTDVVRSAVAEIASLETQGFVYIHM